MARGMPGAAGDAQNGSARAAAAALTAARPIADAGAFVIAPIDHPRALQGPSCPGRPPFWAGLPLAAAGRRVGCCPREPDGVDRTLPPDPRQAPLLKSASPLSRCPAPNPPLGRFFKATAAFSALNQGRGRPARSLPTTLGSGGGGRDRPRPHGPAGRWRAAGAAPARYQHGHTFCVLRRTDHHWWVLVRRSAAAARPLLFCGADAHRLRFIGLLQAPTISLCWGQQCSSLRPWVRTNAPLAVAAAAVQAPVPACCGAGRFFYA